MGHQLDKPLLWEWKGSSWWCDHLFPVSLTFLDFYLRSQHENIWLTFFHFHDSYWREPKSFSFMTSNSFIEKNIESNRDVWFLGKKCEILIWKVKVKFFPLLLQIMVLDIEVPMLMSFRVEKKMTMKWWWWCIWIFYTYKAIFLEQLY